MRRKYTVLFQNEINWGITYRVKLATDPHAAMAAAARDELKSEEGWNVLGAFLGPAKRWEFASSEGFPVAPQDIPQEGEE